MAERALRSKKTGRVMTESQLFEYDSMGLASPSEVFDAYAKTGEYEPVAAPKTPGGFIRNLGNSAIQLVGDTATGIGTLVAMPLTAPVAAWKALNGEPIPEPPKIGEIAGRVKNYAVNRYGSIPKTLDTLYNDPAGAASDAAIILGGVSGGLRGAARLAPKLAAGRGGLMEAARSAQVAADFANPTTFPLTGALTRRVAPGVVDRTAETLYETALKPPTSLTLKQGDEAVKAGIRDRIPVSRKGLKRSERQVNAATRLTDRKVDQIPGRPIEPQPVIDNIDNYQVEVAKGKTTPDDAMRRIGERKDEHLQAHWGMTPEVRDESGAVIQSFTPPGPISAREALDLRRGINRDLGNAVIDQVKSVDVNFDKAVREGVNSELYRVFPELKNIGDKQAVKIRLNEAIDSRLRGLRGTQASMSSAYATSQMGKTVAGNPSAVGAASILHKYILTPQMLSEIAIALKNSGYKAASKRARLLLGEYRLRAKANAASGVGRVNRESAESPISDVPMTEPPAPSPNRDPDDPYGP